MGNEANKRKVAMLGVSGLLLVVIGTAVTIGIASSKPSPIESPGSGSGHAEVSSSMKAIENVCAPTDYKDDCVKSLENSGTTSTNPKELMKAGLNATMKYIHEAAEKSVTLKEIEKDPMAKQALDICSRLMDYSIDELNTSFERLGRIEILKVDDALEELNVWLSGVATFQETCLDGFENVTSDAGAKMREALNMSMKLTSNALAMVGELSSMFGNITIPKAQNHRKLLGDDYFYGDDSSYAGWVGGARSTAKARNHRRLLGANYFYGDDSSYPGWVGGARSTAKGKTSRRLLSDTLGGEYVYRGDDWFPSWVGSSMRHLLAEGAVKPDLVVAKDGSGKYNTINAAIKDIPLNSAKPFVVYVKAGVYNEKVTFDKKITNLVLVGDGPTKTKITGNKNFAGGVKTWDTSTVTVLGNDFVAKDIGFENSAGATGHQAVALLIKSDKAVVFNCQMDGYQDTLYVPAFRQFYRDCVITGTIDFIFGDAAAVFQNCKILIRKPGPNQQCIVTAHGRKESRSRTGIVLLGCTITGDASYMPVKAEFKSYLGRPWKKFARTIVMDTFIDDVIQPEGWLPWAGNFALDTLYYAEYNNKGPGSDTSKRVTWKGIRKLSPTQALTYTPKNFFFEDAWITATGVPYTAGL